MLSLKNRRLRNFLIVTITIGASALLLAFGFRQQFLNWGFQKAQEKLYQKGLNITAADYSFTGFSSVSIMDFSIIQTSKLELIHCDSMEVKLSPLKGLVGLGWVESLSFGNVNLHWDDSLTRISNDAKALEITEDSQNDLVNTGINLNKIKHLLNQLPDEFSVKFIKFEYKKRENDTKITAQKLQWKEDRLQAKIGVEQFKKLYLFSVDGTLHKESLKGNLTIEGINKNRVVISMLGGKFGFSKMALSIDDLKESRDGLLFSTNCNIQNAFAQHTRISDTIVYIDRLIGSPEFHFGHGRIQMDSSSKWRINTFDFQAGFHYPIKDTMGEFWTLLKFSKESGAHLFPSLPVGLFRHTSGIRINGNFGHRFYVWYTPKDLSLTKLEAEIEYGKDFKVVKWGKANPKKINGIFHHDYFDGDRWEAGFEVGPNNPFFTQISQISPKLIQTTLRSEDPDFYYHKGFYLNAFREALMANIQEKRFARGGSTISMQLIKNVFLRQHKTLTRKLEEIILVWLIEHEKVVSKQRMLEVYFNIIEWGPGVFGVGSASQFYFGKTPSQLNWGESCYLTSLIPAPSKAKWSIDSTGNVSPRWSRYFKLKDRMVRLDSANIQTAEFQFRVRAFQ